MEEEEKKEIIVEEKPKNLKKEKSPFRIVLSIALWVILIIWMVVCLFDFINVQNGKEATFCIKETVNKYNDGQVKICTGLGYKVIKYERSSYKAIEFGPFWSDDVTKDKK